MKDPIALIVLPGTLMDNAALQPLVAALGRPARFELLGLADDFDSEIDRLAALAPQNAVWVGHSLGGIAALHLAARHPTRCAAVVALASNVRPDGPQGPHNRVRQLAALHRGGMAAVVRELLAPVYGLPPGDALIDLLQAQAEHVGADRFLRQLRYAADRPGLLRDVEKLRMPVLALSGSHDALAPPACSEEIIARTTDSRSAHHVLQAAGHLLPVQSASWCAQHIEQFLQTLA